MMYIFVRCHIIRKITMSNNHHIILSVLLQLSWEKKYLYSKGEGDLWWFHISVQLILAPRHSIHFLHNIFPGTSDKISCCAKFHSSSCLSSWFPKVRSSSLANWESTLFSQNLAVSNLIFTVIKLYTWLTHSKQLCGMSDMILVSLTNLWCPWQIGNNQTDLCEPWQ